MLLRICQKAYLLPSSKTVGKSLCIRQFVFQYHDPLLKNAGAFKEGLEGMVYLHFIKRHFITRLLITDI